VHVDVFGPSPAWVYRVLPFAPVRKVPKLAELAVPTATAPAPADWRPWPAGSGLVPGDPPLAEHALTTRLAVRMMAAMVRGTDIGEPSAM
jgi:hypothetical protein